MPKVEGRGKVKRYRTLSLPGGKYKKCEIYGKVGKRGGHTVCGKTKIKVKSGNR
jgi:hypothetical protein